VEWLKWTDEEFEALQMIILTLIWWMSGVGRGTDEMLLSISVKVV
jgi:hypothetical protein